MPCKICADVAVLAKIFFVVLVRKYDGGFYVAVVGRETEIFTVGIFNIKTGEVKFTRQGFAYDIVFG